MNITFLNTYINTIFYNIYIIMSGALLQLAALGSQDPYLTSNPEITLFKKKLKDIRIIHLVHYKLILMVQVLILEQRKQLQLIIQVI